MNRSLFPAPLRGSRLLVSTLPLLARHTRRAVAWPGCVRWLSMVPLCALLAGPAIAQVTVTEAWVRGTVPGMQATGAFMRIESRADTRLVAAASPVAPLVEIHEMAMVDNVMRMRAITGLSVPAGKPVDLRPGGYHVMLMNLPKPLERGSTVPITLTFQSPDGRRETVKVAAEVRPLASGAPPASGGGSASGGHSHR